MVGRGARPAVTPANDHEAFSRLLVPLIDPAFRLACAILMDRGEAEDAVQEAAIRAWKSLHGLRDQRDFRPWFMAIVANHCRSQYRRRWRSVLKLATISGERTDSADRSDDAADVRCALVRLSSTDRGLVVLYFYLDRPMPEVAATLGISVGAAKTRLHRALRRLRPLLEPEVTR